MEDYKVKYLDQITTFNPVKKELKGLPGLGKFLNCLKPGPCGTWNTSSKWCSVQQRPELKAHIITDYHKTIFS